MEDWYWEYAPHIGPRVIVIRQKKKIVCTLNKGGEGAADQIVRAVNCYGLLRAACIQAIITFDPDSPGSGLTEREALHLLGSALDCIEEN